jgi:hypothetical protein
MDDLQLAVSTHESQQDRDKKARMAQFYRFDAGESVQVREQG